MLNSDPHYSGLKKHLHGRNFSSDAEVIAAAETWLEGQHSDFFSFDFQQSEQRAEKCIEFRGEYVEYIPRMVAVVCFLPGPAIDLSAHPRIIATGLSIP